MNWVKLTRVGDNVVVAINLATAATIVPWDEGACYIDGMKVYGTIDSILGLSMTEEVPLLSEEAIMADQKIRAGNPPVMVTLGLRAEEFPDASSSGVK